MALLKFQTYRSSKIDDEKVEKSFCATMGGNGILFHVTYDSPKIAEISFGFAEKAF
jgi:hypothetical protein